MNMAQKHQLKMQLVLKMIIEADEIVSLWMDDVAYCLERECVNYLMQPITSRSTANIRTDANYLASLLSWIDIDPDDPSTESAYPTYLKLETLPFHDLRNRVIEHKQQWGISQLHVGSKDEFTEQLDLWFSVDPLQRALEERLGDVPLLKFTFNVYNNNYRLNRTDAILVDPLRELDLCDVQAIKQIWDKWKIEPMAFLRLNAPVSDS